MYILWFKALHIFFMLAWMAGLFYLPRLFVYHATTTSQVVKDEFKVYVDGDNVSCKTINNESDSRVFICDMMHDITVRIVRGINDDMMHGTLDGMVYCRTDGMIHCITGVMIHGRPHVMM